MKTANVRQLRHAFGGVMDWINEGQQVEIIKKGKVIALLSPPPGKNKQKSNCLISRLAGNASLATESCRATS